MPRRVIEHTRRTYEGDHLQVISVFEEGINKEEAKQAIPFSKNHKVLINKKDYYEYKGT